MKLTKHNKKLKTAVNIAPLIDVVFLLIIFCLYLTPTTTASSEEIIIPDYQSQSVKPEDEKNALVIDMNQHGVFFIDGQARSIDELRTYARNHYETGASKDVILRGDVRSSWGAAQTVLRVLKEENLTSFKMAVKPETMASP